MRALTLAVALACAWGGANAVRAETLEDVTEGPTKRRAEIDDRAGLIRNACEA